VALRILLLFTSSLGVLEKEKRLFLKVKRATTQIEEIEREGIIHMSWLKIRRKRCIQQEKLQNKSSGRVLKKIRKEGIQRKVRTCGIHELVGPQQHHKARDEKVRKIQR
jgi:hypothetical protein